MKLKRTLNRNLAIGFGFSLLILLGSSVASFFSIQNLLKSSQLVNHTYEVISDLNDVVSPIRAAETAQRGYLITNDAVFLEPFHGAFEESITALGHVKTLTIDNPVQQVRCEKLRELINKRFGKMEALIKSKQEANLIDPKQLTSGKDYMDSIVSIENDMKNT
ncbi:MAG TPA: CHASE3 domain-containing protein, partial [Puia sp.]|nr:CHASE3 domain-containing protein [Puia sp.]